MDSARKEMSRFMLPSPKQALIAQKIKKQQNKQYKIQKEMRHEAAKRRIILAQ